METVAEDALFEGGKLTTYLEVDTCEVAPGPDACLPRGGLPIVKDAVRLELAEFFGGGRDQLGELIRREVLGVLEDYHKRQEDDGKASVQGAIRVPSYSSGEHSYSIGGADGQEKSRRGGTRTAWFAGTAHPPSDASASFALETAACQHFSDFALASNASNDAGDDQEDEVKRRRSSFANSITSRVTIHFDQEREPSGPLARLVSSQAFESVIRFVVVLNCAFMVYLANEEIKEWGAPAGPSRVGIFAGELCFLAVYFCEMVLKLGVFRLQYFLSRSNCFDCLLVGIDIWDMTTKLFDSEMFSTSYLRIFRLLKLGKALRAMQIVRAFDKLNAFLVCIQGSLASLLWSLVMLNVILYMFSLCIVQIVAMHFREEGDQLGHEGRRAFESMYGSVQVSMLTLFQLTTDGTNWKDSYELISQTGWIGSIILLAFVSFTHIAVINIITGIFVESAMQNLAPDRDSMALDHQFKEEQAAKELEALFRHADKSCTGTVSKDDFDTLVKEGRLPRLLSLMGLREQHARHFFKYLSSATVDGQVPYSSFVRGCMKLKGAATSFDLHMLQVDVQAVQRTLRDLRWRRPADSRSNSK